LKKIEVSVMHIIIKLILLNDSKCITITTNGYTKIAYCQVIAETVDTIATKENLAKQPAQTNNFSDNQIPTIAIN
jgi:hypothetical protein